MVRLIPLLLIGATLSASVAHAAVTFVDHTAKEYAGSDADLVGFGLSNFGLNCSGEQTTTPGIPIVSWVHDIHSSRDRVKGLRRLATYTIHFRIKDRHGNTVEERVFDYDLKKEEGANMVYHNSYRCERPLVQFSKETDMNYATVEYWVTKVGWIFDKTL